MATQFITSRTAPLYESDKGKKQRMTLIFGDEVETTGNPPANKRVPVEFRGRQGFICEDCLGLKPALWSCTLSMLGREIRHSL
jgi:hypothetical protein